MHGNCTRLANRWYCRDNPGGAPGHETGIGAKPHRYCPCGAPIFTDRGLWGVFEPDQTARTGAAAVATRKLRLKAERYASASDTGLVVDWIGEEDLGQVAA